MVCSRTRRIPTPATNIESAANNHAASGLLDGGVSVDQVDEADGSKAISKIFGGNDSGQVASALAGGGAGNSDLIKKLLPILAPDRARLHRQAALRTAARRPSRRHKPAAAADSATSSAASSAAAGGGGGGGDNPLGSILGSVLGGGKGGGLGDILGGLLGGKK